MTGPYTVKEAKELNRAGIPTGGCWRCIRNQGMSGRDAGMRTQWEMTELKFIGHRAFCKKHYEEELDS